MLELVRVACLSEHHSATVLIRRLYPTYWNFYKIKTLKSLSVAEIKTMFAEKINVTSSKYEIEYDKSISSDNDGEIDVKLFQLLVFLMKTQKMTKQLLSKP